MNLEDVFGKKILDHYKNPRHSGKFDKPSFEASATNPICGDCTYMQFEIEDDVIKDAKFESLGCAVSIAAADILVDTVIGKSVKEAKEISREDLINSLDTQLTEHKLECAGMSVDALQRALKAYEEQRK